MEEICGEVDVVNLEYEAFPMGVKVYAPTTEGIDENGNIVKSGGEEVKDYVVPEGFTILLEIAFKTNKQMSLF